MKMHRIIPTLIATRVVPTLVVLMSFIAIFYSIADFRGIQHPQQTNAFAASPDSYFAEQNIFVKLAKKIVPSVVNISSFSTVKSPLLQGNQADILRKFFGDLFQNNMMDPNGEDGGEEQLEILPNNPFGNKKPRLPKAISLGTGFIIDTNLILTNNHVVKDADEIKISFTEATDEKPSDAEVVGRDPDLDIALIRVKGNRAVVPAIFGDSDALEVGEYVIAVGNPVGHGHSVTHGIISAKGRLAPDFPLANYLQTDTPINPGNSGGPLVNLRGEVIGINNAIDQRAQGIGFAIPINLAKKILPQLRTKGVVTRGYIGVLFARVSPGVANSIGLPKDFSGPVVSHVYPGEPADLAGIKPYDVITEFNHKKILSGDDLTAAVTEVSVGESVPLKVLRESQTKNLTIQVGQRPSSQPSAIPAAPAKKKSKKKPQVEIGMSLEDITPNIAKELGLGAKLSGVIISNVNYDSPADQAGLMHGDIILEVNRKAIKNLDHFFTIVKEKKNYLLRIRRSDSQGQELFSIINLDLTVG